MSEPLPIIGPDGTVLGYTDPNDPGWDEFWADISAESDELGAELPGPTTAPAPGLSWCAKCGHSRLRHESDPPHEALADRTCFECGCGGFIGGAE